MVHVYVIISELIIQFCDYLSPTCTDRCAYLPPMTLEHIRVQMAPLNTNNTPCKGRGGVNNCIKL